MMVFEITYVNKRSKRTVDESHFQRSSAFAPVLKMEVGDIARRYASAGYRQIKRVK